jgi:hypothetical protein
MSSPQFNTQFKSLQSMVSHEEWLARVELAACYRLVDLYGMSDLIYNHITLKIPGTDHLLINLSKSTSTATSSTNQTPITASTNRGM